MTTKELLLGTLTFLLIACNTDNKTSNEKIIQLEEIKTENRDSILFNSDSSKIENLKYEFSDFKFYYLTDTIHEDLTGDGQVEKIYFEIEEGKSGVKIIDGKTKEITKIGMGNTFDEMGDDFGWVDLWGITYDKTTNEVLIKDSEIIGGRDIKLENPSIILRKEEAGGGLVTYLKGKYQWVHQSD